MLKVCRGSEWLLDIESHRMHSARTEPHGRGMKPGSVRRYMGPDTALDLFFSFCLLLSCKGLSTPMPPQRPWRSEAQWWLQTAEEHVEDERSTEVNVRNV